MNTKIWFGQRLLGSVEWERNFENFPHANLHYLPFVFFPKTLLIFRVWNLYHNDNVILSWYSFCIEFYCPEFTEYFIVRLIPVAILLVMKMINWIPLDLWRAKNITEYKWRKKSKKEPKTFLFFSTKAITWLFNSQN